MVDRKYSLVDPEKIPYRSRITAWPIQEQITSSIQILLGTMESLTLSYPPPSLSLHLGRQNGSQDLTPTSARFCCVPIIYHMPSPFVYEGPAVAVLLVITQSLGCHLASENMKSVALLRWNQRFESRVMTLVMFSFWRRRDVWKDCFTQSAYLITEAKCWQGVDPTYLVVSFCKRKQT